MVLLRFLPVNLGPWFCLLPGAPGAFAHPARGGVWCYVRLHRNLPVIVHLHPSTLGFAIITLRKSLLHAPIKWPYILLFVSSIYCNEEKLLT